MNGRRSLARSGVSIQQKKNLLWLKILLIMLWLIMMSFIVTGILAYFDIVEIPLLNNLYISLGIKEAKISSGEVTPPAINKPPTIEKPQVIEETLPREDDLPDGRYKVAPLDADSYFASNSTIISKRAVKDSIDVFSQADIFADLKKRGFDTHPITTEYSMDGDYFEEVEISNKSSDYHPTYSTSYLTKEEDLWTVFVVDNFVMATPVSYNLQSELGVEIVISESNTVMSYDSATNKFFETIPNESELIVKTIELINAEALEGLSRGELKTYE